MPVTVLDHLVIGAHVDATFARQTARETVLTAYHAIVPRKHSPYSLTP